MLDDNGNPSGGTVTGIGIDIRWQNGPLGRGEERKEPNGAFVEDVLDGVKQRLEFYQNASEGRFKCEENRLAIEYIEQAMKVLDGRTKRREAAQVEGTHQGN